MDGFFWKLNVVNVVFMIIMYEIVDIVKWNVSVWNLFVVILLLLVIWILGIYVILWCVEVSYYMVLICLGYLMVYCYVFVKFDIF